MNSIDNGGVETNETGVYILSVWLVFIEHGFTFINIMCIHIHAQNPLGVKVQGKQGILIYFTENNADIFLKGKTWSLKL